MAREQYRGFSFPDPSIEFGLYLQHFRFNNSSAFAIYTDLRYSLVISIDSLGPKYGRIIQYNTNELL